MKMTCRTACIVVAFSTLIFPLCATGDVSGIPAVKWDELTLAVRAIESSATFDAAAAAYAKGCSINRRSSKLQLAYLKKTLRLGRPDVASNAARELTDLDANCGLAWGTLAYMHARKSRYLVALTPAVKAAEYESQNKSIVSNAAQLVAWYEAAKRGNIGADIQQTIKALPSSSKPFAAAYKRAKESFKKIDLLKAAKDEQAQQALAEADKVDVKAKALSTKLKSAGRAYDAQAQQLRSATQQLSRAQNEANCATDFQARQSAQRRAASIYPRIRSIRQTMKKQEDAGLKIKKELNATRKDAQSKRSQANKLSRQAKAVADGMPPHFGWLPPAVDGVVTPDATIAKPKTPKGKTHTPGSSYLLPAQESKSTKPKVAPLAQRLAEAEAADKLQMAKLCMTSKDQAMKAKARELLKEIVAKYAATPSAAEAKELLAKDNGS